jgi:nucleoside-diphosphate-sugar epimerase
VSSILVTGAGGFVGSRLIQKLGASGRGLVRRMPDSSRTDLFVKGDLFDDASLAQALEGVETVVHLAALTGKASPAEHRRVNFEGTERLLRAAERAGVSRFIFVSTIAVQFGELQDYPYAAAKLEAESAVQSCSMNWVIVRPTMVLGADSPIQGALTKLATMPVMPIFGRGDAPIQPVDVDDLVTMLCNVLVESRFDGSCWVAAGPEALSMTAFMTRLRRAVVGRSTPKLHLPLGLMLPFVRLGERVALQAMPFTVGQLATFRFDGSVGSSATDLVQLATRDVGRMIGDETLPLKNEADCFAELLTGEGASQAALDAYLRAHQERDDLGASSPFSQHLVDVAAKGTLSARMADGYARFFDKHGSLRRKLVLMLAILECLPPTHRKLDAPVGGSLLAAVPQLVGYGTLSVLCTLLGLLRFAPRKLFARGGN